MSKFCTKCGNALNGASVCGCEMNQTPNVPIRTIEHASVEKQGVSEPGIEINVDTSAVINYFKDLGRIMLAGILNPISTSVYLLSKQLLGVFIGILSISLLSTALFFNAVLNSSQAAIFNSITYILSSLGYFTYQAELSIAFKVALIFNLGFGAILLAVMVIGSLIFTKHALFDKGLALLSSLQFPIILTQLLATLIVYVVPQLAMPVVIVGLFMAVIIFYEGIVKIYNIKNDVAVLITGSVYAICLIGFSFIGQYLFNIL